MLKLNQWNYIEIQKYLETQKRGRIILTSMFVTFNYSFLLCIVECNLNLSYLLCMKTTINYPLGLILCAIFITINVDINLRSTVHN